MGTVGNPPEIWTIADLIHAGYVEEVDGWPVWHDVLVEVDCLNSSKRRDQLVYTVRDRKTLKLLKRPGQEGL